MPRAWTREVPDSFVNATRGPHARALGDIDLPLARKQHEAYLDGLRWLGFEVHPLPPHPASPDACFVEDPVVLAGNVVVVNRSAHPVRALEAKSAGRALREAGFDLVHMEKPAFLDGGDVLRIGRTLFVGRSARTNGAGIEALASAVPDFEVVEVAMPDGLLHLKCACSTPDRRRVLVTEGLFSENAFAGFEQVNTPRTELYAANVVGRKGRVLVPTGFGRTADRLRQAGLEVRALNMSEFRKADGSLTCLSLRESEV